jgi:hypothetical protein
MQKKPHQRFDSSAQRRFVYAADMNQDTDIQLSGPFKALDGSGRTVDIKSLRIFDEGYGVIDLYVDLAAPATDGLHKDQKLIAEISARLRALGYNGPDLAPGDPVIQEKRLVVLDTPDEFLPFAVRKGFKDLTAEFDEE